MYHSKATPGAPPGGGGLHSLSTAMAEPKSSTSNVSMDSLDEDYEEKKKRDLSYELSLDESDIRSHEWYHGPITRLVAETTVELEGDFLVRDCISSPGDFVLTCKSSGNRILHFRMNRLVLHAHTAQETVCYRFEEEAFPTIPDLISYYVSNKKPVSLLSGAVIKVPKARKVPLGHYSLSQIQKQIHKLKNNNRLRQSSLCDSMSSPSPTYSKSRTPNSSSDKRSSSRTNSARSSVKASGPQQECLMEKYLKDVERSCLNLQANIMKQRQSILSNNNLNSSSNNFIPIMNHYRTFHRTGKSEDMTKPGSSQRKNQSTTSLNTSGAHQPSAPAASSSNYIDNSAALTKSPSDSSLYQPFSCFKENSLERREEKANSSHYYMNSGTSTLNRRIKKPNVVVYDTLPRPRPCLSSTQIFYDHPRALPRPRPKVPPPPPPGSINLKLRKKPMAKAIDAAESSEVSSTTDDNTSLLEHQELTPLLSSSSNEENDEQEGSSSSPLPEDPFPLGLNHHEGENTTVVPEESSKQEEEEEENPEEGSAEDQLEDTSLTVSNEPVTAPVAEKESGLRASSSSIEELPMTPLLLSSAFSPSEFRTLYLPKEGNKPLDPTAINAVQRTLLDTESEVLAYHLTKLDMDLLSISLNREYGLPGIKSGLHLLTLVEGKQLREDLMERCLCLKYFILTSILTATSKDQSVALLAKWISIAGQLSSTNCVGFFNVVNALSNAKLRSIGDIWGKLEKHYPEALSSLESQHRPRLKSLNEGKFEEVTLSSVIVPHVVPFLSGCKDLRSLKTFRNMFNEIFKFAKGVPIPEPFPLFNSHIAYAQECSSEKSLHAFRENGLHYINGMGIVEEILLYDLFHTNFHLKLLWGSNGAVNQSCVERVSKFEKVITVLASLCSK